MSALRCSRAFVIKENSVINMFLLQFYSLIFWASYLSSEMHTCPLVSMSVDY